MDERERNVIDQKFIETELQRLHGIPSMRCTLTQVKALMSFDEESHVLKIRGQEIGFVYYRSGYQVEQYSSEDDWKTREALELSQAIKCPSIDFHLTTFKKFQ